MSQRVRDKDDPRYIPARLGGTGAGFTRAGDKRLSSRYLSAISRQGCMSDTPDSRIPQRTIDDSSKVVSKGLIRARGRLVALAALDQLATQVESGTLDAGELVAAGNVGLKAAGMATPKAGGSQTTISIGTLHLDALRARASARIANDPNALRALPSSDATITDSVTSGDVSDDSATG